MGLLPSMPHVRDSHSALDRVSSSQKRFPTDTGNGRNTTVTTFLTLFVKQRVLVEHSCVLLSVLAVRGLQKGDCASSLISVVFASRIF